MQQEVIQNLNIAYAKDVRQGGRKEVEEI